MIGSTRRAGVSKTEPEYSTKTLSFAPTVKTLLKKKKKNKSMVFGKTGGEAGRKEEEGKAKECKTKEDKEKEAKLEDPKTETFLTLLGLIQKKAEPAPAVERVLLSAEFPKDEVLVRLLELIPLSAVNTFLTQHHYEHVDRLFQEWHEHGFNKALPLGDRASNKICYFVFFYTYERLQDGGEESKGKSLLQQIVEQYLEVGWTEVLYQRGNIEQELADDVGLDINVWEQGLKFGRYGLVDMRGVSDRLTAEQALAVMKTVGVEVDREILAMGQQGLSEMALVSLALSSAAPSMTTAQRTMLETLLNVDLTRVTRFNPVVHSLVQRYKLAYLSNYQNMQIGRLPT